MARLKRNTYRFPRWFGVSDEIEGQKATKVHTSPPTAIDHSEAHTHVISGWAGGTYVLPKPINSLDGDDGHIILRGHATQAISFANFNIGTPPALPTNPAKMIFLTWRNTNGSIVTVSTGERDWTH